MDKCLNEIVRRIKEEVGPDKIILFGSRAKERNKVSSDYDICVLKKGVEDKRDLTKRIYQRLFGVGTAVDIIVESPERFNELKDKWFLVHSEIAKHGMVIYEK